MACTMITTGPGIAYFQDQIDNYRINFFKRSAGMNLPNVRFVGEFRKFENAPEEEQMQFFISIPIKNQEQIIIDVIRTLLDSSEHPIAIGLLFDNCTDQSFQKCREFFETSFYFYSKLKSVYFIESDGELFESTCENLLLLFCSEKYFVSLQADIYFNDKSFFTRSHLAFCKLPNLLGVSGRAVMPFRKISKFQEFFTKLIRIHHYLKRVVLFSSIWRELGPYVPGLGYFGDTSNMPITKMKYSRKQINSLYLGSAIIRGPLIWRAEFLKQLNGFDDISFFLGRDDCDLCFRGSLQGYIVGYIPSFCYSYSASGTTRKPRTKQVDEAMHRRSLLAAANPGKLTKEWLRKRKSSEIFFGFIRNQTVQRIVSL